MTTWVLAGLSTALLATVALAQVPPAEVDRFGTGDLKPVLMPHDRPKRGEPRQARGGKPMAPATRALMWRRPARMGSQLTPTGALTPR